ncbi:LAMI_0E10176g1_1 [Lachancea mirantina]|uniref:LAMI_0E10176g1_1 n=1 Tax=Lachancea mirantina TaxID=1230905 RepID=A0A1G4JNX8_9SACH|nr:LAMI_0E10176g1_1 [Lachancea mirantina]
MTKKDKKDKKTPKVTTVVNKEGETIKVFEDLDSFELFLRNETEDEEFDHVRCHLKYYPPFVLHESHEDPDKIKDTANSHSRKFVRHLHQHVEKRLLKDIREKTQFSELNFKDKSKEKTTEHIVWKYNDHTKLNGKEFDVHVIVECHGDSAYVDVDYLTEPTTARASSVPAVAAV